MKVKVCGMTQVEQINQLNDLHIDFVGFIFYEKSPRYVLNHLTEKQIKNIKGDFKKVGVFVNASEDFILQTIENCGLDLVQLHGDESPEFVNKIAAEVPVIKAFGVSTEEDFENNIARYSDVVDYFLFDTSSKNYGGTGKKFDWNLLHNPKLQTPFFLSGGIGPDDAGNIHSLTNSPNGKYLFSLDINSRFEIAHGIKDISLIERFLKNVKQ